MYEVTLINRVRNEEMQRRTVVVRELTDRAEQGILRWFGHVERMDEGHLGEEDDKF